MENSKYQKGFFFMDVTQPKDSYEVLSKSYWVCASGNPETALFFGQSPQCNKDKRIGEWLLKGTAYKSVADNLEIVFIETAFIPRRDY